MYMLRASFAFYSAFKSYFLVFFVESWTKCTIVSYSPSEELIIEIVLEPVFCLICLLLNSTKTLQNDKNKI